MEGKRLSNAQYHFSYQIFLVSFSLISLANMIDNPREEAHRFIDKVRRKNGGLRKEHQDFLGDSATGLEILDTFNEVRQQLGATARMYVRLQADTTSFPQN